MPVLTAPYNEIFKVDNTLHIIAEFDALVSKISTQTVMSKISTQTVMSKISTQTVMSKIRKKNTINKIPLLHHSKWGFGLLFSCGISDDRNAYHHLYHRRRIYIITYTTIFL